MATGISMSSVNKIKELAENGEYGLALDILENQDLSKSLSPQFIRVCGEVYYENHKYHEARAALVRAHSMAPAGNKIIFSLIQLYLTMGLRTLADKYYEVYKFNLEGREDAGKIRLEYLFAKADRRPVSELHAMLVSANDKEKAERWEYEHLLILAALKEQEKLKYEGEVFKATYKKSIYIDDVNELLAGTADSEKKLYCFPENEVADDAAEDADTRKMEERVLESDDYRLNPTAPTITLMVENDEPVSGTMKIKQTLARNKAKREEKKEKKKLAKAEAESNVQNTEGENSETASEKHEKRGFFKRRMSKQEEEEIMEALAGIKESNDDNTTLLNKIMDEEEAQTKNNEGCKETEKTVKKPETPKITEDETAEKAEASKETETSEEPKVSEAGESGETGMAAEVDKADKTGSDETEQPVETQKAEAQDVDSSEENTDTAQTEAQDAISEENTDTVQAEAKDADIDEDTEKAAEVGASEADRVVAAPIRKSIVLESVKIKPDISDIKITTMSGDDYTSDDFDPMFDETDLDDQINSIIESEINGDRDSLAYNDVVREVEQQEMERKRKHDERVSSDLGLDKDRDSMISNMELTEDSMSYKANASADSSDSKAVSPEYVTDNTELYGAEAAAEGSDTHTADVEGKIDSETATDKDNTDSTETNNKNNDSDDETEVFDFISIDEDEEVSFAENADEDDMVTIDHSQIPDSVEEVEIEDLSKSEDVKLVDLMDTLTDVSEVSVDMAEETSEPETSELEDPETKTSGLEVDEEKTESEESNQPEQLETEMMVEAETDQETTPIVETEPETETFESEVETEAEEATTEGETEEATAETEVKPVETTETETIEMTEAETEEAVEAEMATEVEPETVTEAEVEIEPETVTEVTPEAEPEVVTETENEPEEAAEDETDTELEPEEITTPDELDQMLREIEMISRENEKIVKEYEDTARAEETQPVEEEEPEPVKYGFQSDKLVGDEGYEFPIFRSELFPEYNSDDKNGGNKVFNPDDIKLENQEKIDEHLAKEEALLKETDELLARLGIELGTKYYSGSDYFTKEQFEEDHEAVKRMDASINQKQDKKTKENNSRFKLR